MELSKKSYFVDDPLQLIWKRCAGSRSRRLGQEKGVHESRDWIGDWKDANGKRFGQEVGKEWNKHLSLNKLDSSRVASCAA